MNEQAKQIAEQLNISFERLADDIWEIAKWMEIGGNRGYQISTLEQAQLPVQCLNRKFDAAWKGILFYAEGRRKRDFDGWGVRKNPHWSLAWSAIYGETDPKKAEEIAEAERQRIAKEEAERQRAAARPAERFAEGKFSEFSTDQIGMRKAIAWVLREQAGRRYRQRMLHEQNQIVLDEDGKRLDLDERKSNSAARYMCAVWDDQVTLMNAELAWRSQYQNDQSAIPSASMTRFFTQAQMQRWIDSDDLPGFRDGHAGQPYDEAIGLPVDRLSDPGVIHQFMRMLDPEWAKIGQYAKDDLSIIVGILRQQLKRLKPAESDSAMQGGAVQQSDE